VQRFSGNNFPVTFKRGLRSVEEKQRNAKQIEANEKERDGSGLAGDAGDCAETWLQSTNPRETTPPPTAYSSPSLLSLFSLFLPPPPCTFSLAAHQTRAISFPRIFPPSSPLQLRDAGCVRSSKEQLP